MDEAFLEGEGNDTSSDTGEEGVDGVGSGSRGCLGGGGGSSSRGSGGGG